MTVEDQRIPWQRRALVATASVFIAAVVVYFIHSLATGEAVIQKKVVPDVVTMRLVEPPPPPPPPPPPKMVEQPKMRELEMKPTPLENVPPQPKMNNATPPPGPLALDSAGQGPPDSFGLAGRPGGGDILGGSGGAQGSAYGWYATLLEGRIQDLLQHTRRLRGSRYDVAVSIWLAPDGTPQKVELVSSSGKREIDEILAEALKQMRKLPQPPQGMPQPVVVKVSSS